MRRNRYVVVASLLVIALANPAGATPAQQLAQLAEPADSATQPGAATVGKRIERLVEPPEASPTGRPQNMGKPVDGQAPYYEPSHGDSDTDMEHRKHRTLGDDRRD